MEYWPNYDWLKMLETLKIKNIAVIDSAEIPFKPGLNILSGETGAALARQGNVEDDEVKTVLLDQRRGLLGAAGALQPTHQGLQRL